MDGILEKKINVKTCIPHEDKEELTATSNTSTTNPSTLIQVQQRSQQVTSSKNNRTMSCNQESTTPSTPQRPAMSSNLCITLSDMLSPSSASIRRQNFRNLSEFYDQTGIDSSAGQNSLFALFCHVDDLIHFEDVVKEEKWIATMDEEIGEIKKNDTWELVDLPKGKEVIGVKWIYKTKRIIDRKIEQNKARLVVKGYKQKHGRDYAETFVLVTRMETTCTLSLIAAKNKWKVYQMDVKSTFLNGVLKDEVYVAQPLGYEVEGEEDKVY